MSAQNATATNGSGLDVLWEAFRRSLVDFINYLPSIAVGVGIILVYVIIVLILNSLLRKLFSVARIDDLLKPVHSQVGIRVSSLLIGLIDAGVFLLAIYTVIVVFAPGYVGTANEILNYIGRVVSVVVVLLITFIFINVIIGYVRVEAKLRGFMFLTLLFITLVVVIDITNLSQEIKNAVAWGISVGLAALISVFSLWFFLHEYIESRTSASRERAAAREPCSEERSKS